MNKLVVFAKVFLLTGSESRCGIEKCKCQKLLAVYYRGPSFGTRKSSLSTASHTKKKKVVFIMMAKQDEKKEHIFSLNWC